MSNVNGKFVNGAWIEFHSEPPMSQLDRLQCEFVQFVNYVNDLVTAHNEIAKNVDAIIKFMNEFTKESKVVDTNNGQKEV